MCKATISVKIEHVTFQKLSFSTAPLRILALLGLWVAVGALWGCSGKAVQTGAGGIEFSTNTNGAANSGGHSGGGGASIGSNSGASGSGVSGTSGAVSGIGGKATDGSSGIKAGAGGTVSNGGTGATGGAGGTSGSGGTASTCPKHASGATFRNPLNTAEGSDPYMVYYDCFYYLTATTWNSTLTIAKAATLAELKTTKPVTVWTGTESSSCCNAWAPELHQLNGPNGLRWYLYYTAGPAGTNFDGQRNHVLESEGTDPMGPYKYKARIYDTKNDTWAIDASVVTIQNKLYFLFSAWEGDYQNLYIAAMTDPWTISGSRVRISQPTNSWETSQSNVNEGPVALQRNGRTFVIYSASGCMGPDYKLGMLTLTGSDPLSASSWTKSAQPVFERADANSVYGPGHNGFFKSPDGKEDWIVYHANASSSGGCDTKRTTRAQKFTWNSDGTPTFGAPVSTTTDLPAPSGE